MKLSVIFCNNLNKQCFIILILYLTFISSPSYHLCIWFIYLTPLSISEHFQLFLPSTFFYSTLTSQHRSCVHLPPLCLWSESNDRLRQERTLKIKKQEESAARVTVRRTRPPPSRQRPTFTSELQANEILSPPHLSSPIFHSFSPLSPDLSAAG